MAQRNADAPFLQHLLEPAVFPELLLCITFVPFIRPREMSEQSFHLQIRKLRNLRCLVSISFANLKSDPTHPRIHCQMDREDHAGP